MAWAEQGVPVGDIDAARKLEGTRLPEVTFKILAQDQLLEVWTRDLFGGRAVVLFALPGAYTPTCSNRHVPRFNELAVCFQEQGIEDVVCLSVNDPYVMVAWAEEQQAERLTFIPDSDGEFTRRLGMLVDKSDAGLGMRSRRYSLLVRDSIVEKAFVEPDIEGDPFEVSDADTMLRYLSPHHPALAPVTMFAKHGCPFCARAKHALESRGLAFECIYIDEDVTMSSVLAATGAATVPQVFIGGRLIGGADELDEYFNDQGDVPAITQGAEHAKDKASERREREGAAPV